MIYNSIDTLPVKLFYRIQETGDFSLLNPKGKKHSEDLPTLFDHLTDSFNKIDKGSSYDSEFFLQKEIAHMEAKKRACIAGIEILRFELIWDVKEELEKALNIRIRTNVTNYYYKDLERADYKVADLDKKINVLKKQLKSKNNSEGPSSSIDDLLASISTILGVSFDFNTISCTTYLAYKRQTESKINTQQDQLRKLKLN